MPGVPAKQFKGEWASGVAAQICNEWVASQTAKAPTNVSIPDLAHIAALEYERKHPGDIPAHQRLLPSGARDEDYLEAQVRTFLTAVGEDPDKVLESFKKAGLGGLHRQHAVLASSTTSAIGIAQTMAPDPTTKTVLSGVRWVLQLFATRTILDSAKRRFRNSGSEEVMVDGRADAPKSAKEGDSLLQASFRLVRDLRGAEKNLRQIEAALADLEAAYSRHDQAEVQKAHERLDIAHAKFCYLAELKSRYKTASESAKVEWYGNQRSLIGGYVGNAVSLPATVLAILTPGLVAAPVTAGVSAGAAALSLALYFGYQLSNGPSKDGEAKAKRAIVALIRSDDVLDGHRRAIQKERAQAYKSYREQKKKARWYCGQDRVGAEAKARRELLAELQKIAQKDAEVLRDVSEFEPRKNWEDYRDYVAAEKRAQEVAAADPSRRDEVKQSLEVLKAKFESDHKAHFNPKAVAEAWKTPLRMRFDSARRLLAGKVAEAHGEMMRHHKKTAALRRSLRRAGREEVNLQGPQGMDQETKLKAQLLELFNLELALNRMQQVIDGKSGDPDATMGLASQALGAVQNTYVRDLFCGDSRQQVDATKRAKILTIGEQQRYTYTNGGSAAVGILANLVATTAGMIINSEKAALAAQGIHFKTEFADEKDFIPLSQTSAPFTAHYTAANRTTLQKTWMQWILEVLEREGDPIELPIALPAAAAVLDEQNPWVAHALERLVQQLAQTKGVPDKIAITFLPPGGAPGARSTQVSVNLKGTKAYYDYEYQQASPSRKARYQARKARAIANETATSLLGLVVQVAAQPPLRKTRKALNGAAALGPDVRKKLRMPSDEPAFPRLGGQNPQVGTSRGGRR
ncbi:hypothetical protein [Paraburkholderia sp. CI3]|uniref:hypothetical protein n=1 Tax=Paraburkholderia sp. CI3 TaxID=2991060 RepID=UPI003D234E6B